MWRPNPPWNRILNLVSSNPEGVAQRRESRSSKWMANTSTHVDLLCSHTYYSIQVAADDDFATKMGVSFSHYIHRLSLSLSLWSDKTDLDFLCHWQKRRVIITQSCTRVFKVS